MNVSKPERSGPLTLLQQAGFAALPEGWSVIEVGDLLSEDRGISVGVMYPGDHTPGGVPLLKVGDLSGNRINQNSEYCISQETHRQYRRTELRGGELLLTLVGAIGQCAVVPSSMSGWNAARAIAVIRLENEKDAEYVRYCLLSQPLQHLMQAWATTTVQATLNLKEIKQLPLPWPSESERQRIVQIAGCLEAKIEVNRETNETLEAMARTLFQSWFVDFDPVRAKADGQKPQGMDTATAKLFPDSFEPSALGPIPKGWRVATLSDLLTLQRGFDLPSPSRVQGRYPVIAASGENGTHNEFMVRGPGVTTGRSGVLGKVFFVIGDFWPLNTSLWVKEFKECTPAFAFHVLSGIDFGVFNAGSAVPTLNRNHVHTLPVVIPPRPLIEAFDKVAYLCLSKQHAADEESRTLAATRDALLPKLLSGEVQT